MRHPSTSHVPRAPHGRLLLVALILAILLAALVVEVADGAEAAPPADLHPAPVLLALACLATLGMAAVGGGALIGGSLITDLSSRQSTRINGQRISAATPLHPHDRVVIGETHLRIEAPAGDVL